MGTDAEQVARVFKDPSRGQVINIPLILREGDVLKAIRQHQDSDPTMLAWRRKLDEAMEMRRGLRVMRQAKIEEINRLHREIAKLDRLLARDIVTAAWLRKITKRAAQIQRQTIKHLLVKYGKQLHTRAANVSLYHARQPKPVPVPHADDFESERTDDDVIGTKLDAEPTQGDS